MIEPGMVITIPARRGKAERIREGQVIKVINTHGQQVVDTWAFNARDLTEFMSMEHSRAAMKKIIPEVGDTLVTNRRRPILQVVEDTTPGVHDTLLAACDRYRYEQLGCKDYHDNCTDNLTAALKALGASTQSLRGDGGEPRDRPRDRAGLRGPGSRCGAGRPQP